MHVSDPWVQLALACSLISRCDPCCCTDPFTQRNQCNSLKCLSVPVGDQCALWRKPRARGGRMRGRARRTQKPRADVGESRSTEEERCTVGWEVRKLMLHAVIDECSHKREIVSLEARWPMTNPSDLMWRQHSNSAFVFKLRRGIHEVGVCL